MSDFISTLVFTGILVALALTLMSAGWLLTHKKCLRRGCGHDPHSGKEKRCSCCKKDSLP